MNREQCEAKALELAQSSNVFVADYYMTRSQLLALIAFAWQAGSNYGFKEGGQHRTANETT